MELQESNKIVKFSDIEKKEVNPFVTNHGFEIKLKTKGVVLGTSDKMIVDNDTGEMTNMKVIGAYKELDQQSFVKIYKEKVSCLFGLSKSGTKVFGYIVQQLKQGLDTVYVHIPDLMENVEWTQTKMAYKGLTELVEARIIWPSTKPNLYFINPTVLFNGDRIAFIEAYRKGAPAPVTPDPLKIGEVACIPETEE